MNKTYTRLVNYKADVCMRETLKLKTVEVDNLLVEWNPEEMSLTATEYWSACDHIAEVFDFDWFSIESWGSTPVEGEKK